MHVDESFTTMNLLPMLRKWFFYSEIGFIFLSERPQNSLDLKFPCEVTISGLLALSYVCARYYANTQKCIRKLNTVPNIAAL
jgi:hypothetical protein